MRFRPQVAHNRVQHSLSIVLDCKVGAIAWGFQQVSPRYGVLLLDAPMANWVQLLQLARRNLRPESGSQRPGCEYSNPVNQPPLAKAPLGSEHERVCADKAVLKGFTAQRACRDAILGEASGRTVSGSPERFRTEMTSNCKSSLRRVLPKNRFDAVSASKSTDRCSLSNSQGVHSC